MQIHIRRDQEEFGPYSREAVVEYLKQGILVDTDLACYTGMTKWKPLGQLLGSGEPMREFGTPAGGGAAASRKSVKMTGGSGSSRKTGMVILNLVLVAITVTAAYLKFGGGARKLHQYFSANSLVAAAPGDTSAASTPTPGPDANSTSESGSPAASSPAQQKPFDPSDIAANPAEWPRTVRLLQPVIFPAMFNGRAVGTVTVPAGSAANVVKIDGDTLTLQYRGGVQSLSWKMTNLQAEVAKLRSNPPPATPGN